MDQFNYPAKYVVYQLDPDLHNWIPALFDHRERQYFLQADNLAELIPLMTSGLVTGDSDPVNDLRVVEIGSGDLYQFNNPHQIFSKIEPQPLLDGPDKHWFDFV